MTAAIGSAVALWKSPMAIAAKAATRNCKAPVRAEAVPARSL
jgi:hypothetical protein